MVSGPRISAVVCTHNRATLLRQALESLVCQTLDRARYEIIVVDNCSTDDTPSVVDQFNLSEPRCSLRSVYEPMLGLGYARNTGWHCAKGVYVAFMDDDAKADPRWLEGVVETFESGVPTPIAVGGPILPFYVSPKPAWYKDEYEVRSWGSAPRRLTPGESFSGSNMIFAREVLERLNGFDVRVGMQGERVSMGEETVLFKKIWETLEDRAVLAYSPQLVVYHAVAKQKMSPRYHLTRWFVAGQVAWRLDEPSSWRDRFDRLRLNITAIRMLTSSAIKQWRRFSDHRAWMVELLGPVALETGRLLAGIGLCVPVRRGKLSEYPPQTGPDRGNPSIP